MDAVRDREERAEDGAELGVTEDAAESASEEQQAERTRLGFSSFRCCRYLLASLTSDDVVLFATFVLLCMSLDFLWRLLDLVALISIDDTSPSSRPASAELPSSTEE